MKNLALCGAVILFGACAANAQAAPPASTTAPAPQSATPAPVAPKAGDVVYDNTGQQAGSVESVNGNVVVVATEQGKGSMPLTEFTMGEKGLTMNHTKAELETAIRNARAQEGSAAQTPSTAGEAPKAPSS